MQRFYISKWKHSTTPIIRDRQTGYKFFPETLTGLSIGYVNRSNTIESTLYFTETNELIELAQHINSISLI